jgi:hypothetical protein
LKRRQRKGTSNAVNVLQANRKSIDRKGFVLSECRITVEKQGKSQKKQRSSIILQSKKLKSKKTLSR